MLITWRNLVLKYSDFLGRKISLVYFQTSCQYATNDDNTYNKNCKKSLNIMQFYMIPDTA